MALEALDIDQPGQVRDSRRVTIEQQFIGEALTTLGAVRDEVFELSQACQVELQLRVAEATGGAQFGAREAHVLAPHAPAR